MLRQSDAAQAKKLIGDFEDAYDEYERLLAAARRPIKKE
jgi:preprotein translocase subunit Sss1